jgi:beta-phosphoglucomutase-like phosphatase (HAD superfamily)
MFELCMFDLDDTLVRTEDLQGLREACKHRADAACLEPVRASLASRSGRPIYSLELLRSIRAKHPQLKLGIFTRSPRSYTDTVLGWAYPGFAWDCVVSYEDVKHTKPHGDGIRLAMDKLGLKAIERVLLVGDSDVDVRAAYHGGCWVTLDRSAWPRQRLPDHWRALAHMPDAQIGKPSELLDVLDAPAPFLPELERLLAAGPAPAHGARIDKINHFIPPALGAERPYPVYACGRSFSNKRSLSTRRSWHPLTASIEAHKDADEFPNAWIEAIRAFLADECAPFFDLLPDVHVLLTVVPHRPERKARLERLLAQVQLSLATAPVAGCNVDIAPQLLAYREGVRSQHNDLLNQHDRFTNVRDHLFVQLPHLIDPKATVVVIDDVCTTGASLIYATKYLREAGATDIKCLALAKNIGDVLAWND